MRRFLVVLAALPFLTGASPVARVLDEDPPLPGAALTGWEALAPSDPDARALTVDEAVATALAVSPELSVARAAVRSAEGERLDTWALPNPSVTFEPYERAGLSLDVTDALVAPWLASAAAPEVRAARFRADEEALRVAYAARAAFYDHEAAVVAWEASLRSVDALAASRDTARAMGAAGNATPREVVLREVVYEEARLSAAEREIDVVRTREVLARLLGEVPGPLAPSQGALPAIPDDLEARAVAASLALAALESDASAARRGVVANRLAGVLPEVEIEASTSGRDLAFVGVGVEVPLFAAGRGDTRQALARVDSIAAVRARAEFDVRSAARELALRQTSAARRARHYDEVLIPARERALRETLLQYNAMQVGIDVLLDAWRARVDAEVGRADSWREARTAAAAVEALLAGALVSAPRTASAPSGIGSVGDAH